MKELLFAIAIGLSWAVLVWLICKIFKFIDKED